MDSQVVHVSPDASGMAAVAFTLKAYAATMSAEDPAIPEKIYCICPENNTKRTANTVLSFSLNS